MEKEKKLEALRGRYVQGQRRLARTAWILKGTITRRTIQRQDPQNPRKQKAYGPYYQWTWKSKGKTVTVNLKPSQAKAYQEAIGNNQALEKTLKEMRVLSLKVLEATFPGVKKRRSRRKNALP